MGPQNRYLGPGFLAYGLFGHMAYFASAISFVPLPMPFRLRSTLRNYSKLMMMKTTALILNILAAVSLSLPADARRGDDQGGLRADVLQGKVKSPREIESRILPRMRGMQYLGPEYDSVAQVYRLKFIDKDRVIFVDVDARTGNILQQR